MILHIENPKDRLLELINLVKLQDTQHTKISCISLYTKNELSEKEIRKTIPFTIAPKRVKYSGQFLNLSLFQFLYL